MVKGKPDCGKFVIALLVMLSCLVTNSHLQNGGRAYRTVKAKIEKMNDYEASGEMKTNVVFIKAPVIKVKIYFKNLNKLRIKNETGIFFYS